MENENNLKDTITKNYIINKNESESDISRSDKNSKTILQLELVNNELKITTKELENKISFKVLLKYFTDLAPFLMLFVMIFSIHSTNSQFNKNQQNQQKIDTRKSIESRMDAILNFPYDNNISLGKIVLYLKFLEDQNKKNEFNSIYDGFKHSLLLLIKNDLDLNNVNHLKFAYLIIKNWNDYKKIFLDDIEKTNLFIKIENQLIDTKKSLKNDYTLLRFNREKNHFKYDPVNPKIENEILFSRLIKNIELYFLNLSILQTENNNKNIVNEKMKKFKEIITGNLYNDIIEYKSDVDSYKFYLR